MRQRLNLLDWDALLGRKCREVIELGLRVHDLAVAASHLEANGPDCGVDGDHLAIEAVARHLLIAYANRGRLAEHQVG